MADPRRGEIWLANLSPTVGHEQAGPRPVLVISRDSYNQSRSTLVVCLPLTTTTRAIPLHVVVTPPEGGLRTQSTILTDQIRTISKSRLSSAPFGMVSAQTMAEVEERLRTLLVL